jgi:hypothetical protein
MIRNAHGLCRNGLALVAIWTATASLTACYNQHSMEGTSSRTVSVAGRKLKADLSPTGAPNEYDLLIVRDSMVYNPDPETERERGQEAASRVMREVCNLRGLRPQILNERLVEQINYYVRFRCA